MKSSKSEHFLGSLNLNRDGGDITEKTITSTSQGLNLHARYWTPKSDQFKGLVIICHGFGEHLGWYDEIGMLLAANGFLAFGHDHLGHGKSEGKRVIVNSISIYVDDVMQHAAAVKKQHQDGLPIYVYGHSMGGMIAISAIIRNEQFFRGMILEGALIVPDPHETTPMKLLAVHLLSPILPELQIGNIRVEQVTSDEDIQTKFQDDKLRWSGGFKLKMGLEFYKCLVDNRNKLNTITIPMLILHGQNDSLCDVVGSHTLHEESKSKDKTIKIYQGARHHLILENPDIREEVLTDILTWLLQHTQ